MATSSFKVALQGKVVRGLVAFSNEAGPATIEISPNLGGLKPSDYSIVGIPLGRQRDTVTIDTAANNEDYTITIKGRPFTVDSGGAATVTTIRDALLALLTAPIQTQLGIVAASSGADSITIDALTPGGDPLNTSVTADTPANISVAKTALGLAATILACAKLSGKIEFRATTSITESKEFAVIG